MAKARGRPARRRVALPVAEVAQRLRRQYGERPPRKRLPPIDELIETILSQNTSDLNSGRAYARLLGAFGSLEVVRHTLHRYGLTAAELHHAIASLRDETPSYEAHPWEDPLEPEGEEASAVKEHVRVRRRRWY